MAAGSEISESSRPRAKTDSWEEELLWCARTGELENVKKIIAWDKHPLEINAVDESGASSLHMASANGHVEIVRELHKAGAKYFANTSGNTPLQWAVQMKHVEVVRVLLELYAEDIDVTTKNDFGKSVLMEAGIAGNEDIASLVASHPSAAAILGAAEAAFEDKPKKPDSEPLADEKKEE